MKIEVQDLWTLNTTSSKTYILCVQRVRFSSWTLGPIWTVQTLNWDHTALTFISENDVRCWAFVILYPIDKNVGMLEIQSKKQGFAANAENAFMATVSSTHRQIKKSLKRTGSAFINIDRSSTQNAPLMGDHICGPQKQCIPPPHHHLSLLRGSTHDDIDPNIQCVQICKWKLPIMPGVCYMASCLFELAADDGRGCTVSVSRRQIAQEMPH